MTSPLKKVPNLLTLALLTVIPAYSWGVEGHQAIAIMAADQLTPEARRHVVQILGSDDLASIAVWMDQLRSAYFHTGPLKDDPEAHAFDAKFPNNGEWHYVDLPLGLTAYDLNGPFSKPDDVVHIIEESVRVLEGQGDRRITQLQALRMLVHFVGDEHQPLHVGVGFFEVNDGAVKLVTDPEKAKDLPNDKGGNTDFYGPGRYEELHGFWDDAVVEKILSSKSPKALAAVLETKIAREGSDWKSPGDYHHWAEGWADESLRAALIAYQGIVFGEETPDAKGGIKKMKMTFPANYDATAVPLAEKRLAEGGYHLGELLNAIHWSD